MSDEMSDVEAAFRAGYHCQWIRAERRYIFDPAMTPGDPGGAYAAWRRDVGLVNRAATVGERVWPNGPRVWPNRAAG